MNDEIYMFNGKNITMNVCLQIRDVVHLIQKAYQASFEDAVAMFYLMNPEKTDAELGRKELDSLEDVMNYAVNEEKTEKKFYLSGVNCNPAIARKQFQIVKSQFRKEGGIVAYHGYQSFAEGEVTPQQAHDIGLELAKTIWGEGYQVVVATHLNTHCLHNHLVVNSVSFQDGKRCRQKQWTEISKINDAICRKYLLHRKYWTIRQKDWKRPIRLIRMGEESVQLALKIFFGAILLSVIWYTI